MKNIILFSLIIFQCLNLYSQCTATITNQTNLWCNVSCSGSATATMTGGVAPYTYLWNTSPNQTTQTATNLCAGSYSVTVIDSNNCIALTSANITSPPPIVVSTTQINVTDSLCNGSITWNVSGGIPPYTYAWSTPPYQFYTPTITNLCAGTYWGTVTDGASCCYYLQVLITNSNEVNSIKNNSTIPDNSETTMSAKIYPNPSVDSFFIEFENPYNKPVLITVSDLTNKIIFETKCYQNKYELRKGSIKQGVYNIKITDYTKTSFKKIIIK
ncbi:MAG: hypothetical protein A2491_14685 [Bacteroidetes bacterium RIFOXYC12_FULL_35_7]|nr:MAG: hypothetical protein A2491_14685 [Bacteroidetes bacterium RIFOXYC12_FULL_35_7]